MDGQILAAHSLPSRALPAELSCCDLNSAWPQLHILNWPYFPHTSLDQPEARVPLLQLHSLLHSRDSTQLSAEPHLQPPAVQSHHPGSALGGTSAKSLSSSPEGAL